MTWKGFGQINIIKDFVPEPFSQFTRSILDKPQELKEDEESDGEESEVE